MAGKFLNIAHWSTQSHPVKKGEGARTLTEKRHSAHLSWGLWEPKFRFPLGAGTFKVSERRLSTPPLEVGQFEERQDD